MSHFEHQTPIVGSFFSLFLMALNNLLISLSGSLEINRNEINSTSFSFALPPIPSIGVGVQSGSSRYPKFFYQKSLTDNKVFKFDFNNDKLPVIKPL